MLLLGKKNSALIISKCSSVSAFEEATWEICWNLDSQRTIVRSEISSQLLVRQLLFDNVWHKDNKVSLIMPYRFTKFPRCTRYNSTVRHVLAALKIISTNARALCNLRAQSGFPIPRVPGSRDRRYPRQRLMAWGSDEEAKGANIRQRNSPRSPAISQMYV